MLNRLAVQLFFRTFATICGLKRNGRRRQSTAPGLADSGRQTQEKAYLRGKKEKKLCALSCQLKPEKFHNTHKMTNKWLRNMA